MRSFYITCDLFLRKKKSKVLEKDRIFLVFLTVSSKKKGEKKQAASKKEAGGDAKHVLFFLLRLIFCLLNISPLYKNTIIYFKLS